jgi:hypothetical protein
VGLGGLNEKMKRRCIMRSGSPSNRGACYRSFSGWVRFLLYYVYLVCAGGGLSDRGSGCAKTRVPSIGSSAVRGFCGIQCVWWIGDGDSLVRLWRRWFGKSKRGNEHRDRVGTRFDIYLLVYAIKSLLCCCCCRESHAWGILDMR